MAINPDITVSSELHAVATAVRAAGGRAWLVGGTVRDGFLGRPSGDLDIEVHGLSAAALHQCLRRLGPTRQVGRSFGVFKLRIGPLTLDLSLPAGRTEAGDRQVGGDPGLQLAEAARRRDLSVNAIAYDPLTGEVADPCGGVADIEARRLRAADPERFGDDPLRTLRVARFAATLGFSIDPDLVALCRSIDPSTQAPERVAGELQKILLDAPRPGLGLRAARHLGLVDRLLPELGDPDPSLAEALDRAAQLRDCVGPPPRDLALMLAVLLSPAGPQAADAVLERLKLHSSGGYRLRPTVPAVLATWPTLAQPITDAQLRHLAETVEVQLAARVAQALSGAPCAAAAVDRAAALGVAFGPLPPLLTGRDLGELGVPAGPAMGGLLRDLRQAQLDGEVRTPDQATALIKGLWSKAAPDPQTAG
jgi:hypothetical protein